VVAEAEPLAFLHRHRRLRHFPVVFPSSPGRQRVCGSCHPESHVHDSYNNVKDAEKHLVLTSHLTWEGSSSKDLTITGKPEKFASFSATLIRYTDIFPKMVSAGESTDNMEGIGPPMCRLRIRTKSGWS
jgi:hypothetical protein